VQRPLPALLHPLPRRDGGRNVGTDEVKAILDKLAEQGVLFLLLTGGEIFARCDFREIYLHAKRLGFLLTLFTNATLIDEDTADFLAEWPPRRIEVTIYGHTEATYEKVTGVRGSFKRFRRGVELLRERNLPLALKTVAMKTNRHEFEQVQAWAEGARHPVPLRRHHQSAPRRRRRGPRRAARPGGRRTARRHDRRACRTHYQKLLDKAQTRARSEKAFSCGAGIKTFHVDPRGHLHPCMMWRATPYDFKAGTLAGWRAHVEALRETRIPADSGCRSCAHHLGCNNCAATSALENRGVPGKPVDYYCRINQSREKLLDLRRFEVREDSTIAVVS
jgi:radical SAM protein with 4Fe4S-binding SPASM domain